MAKRDLSIFASGTDSTPREQTLLQTTAAGRSVTGAEKLIQRFVLCLFTDLESIAFEDDNGTSYVGNVVAGNLSTEFEAIAYFNQAIEQATFVLQRDEEDTDPDDERFAGAKLLQLTIAQDELAVTIQVTSVAGTKGLITMPIRFTGSQT